MARLLHLVVFGIIVFICVKATTFGWRFTKTDIKMDRDKDIILIENNLKRYVYMLSEDIGDRNLYKIDMLNKAADYISQMFDSYGYKSRFQDFVVSGITVKNIIAEKTGKSTPQKIILVGAHYDTCFNPGADDNASGVATLIELARLLSEKELEATIKFIAFVNEEPPFFKSKNMGSFVYANLARENKEQITSVLILESIGYYSDRPNSQRYPPLFGPFYPNKGNFIAVVGNIRSSWLVKRFVRFFKEFSDFPIESISTFEFIPGVDFSDNWSFWRFGFPAIMITDTAFYRNPNYHSVKDTFGTLDYSALSEVVRTIFLVICKLSADISAKDKLS